MKKHYGKMIATMIVVAMIVVHYLFHLTTYENIEILEMLIIFVIALFFSLQYDKARYYSKQLFKKQLELEEIFHNVDTAIWSRNLITNSAELSKTIEVIFGITRKNFINDPNAWNKVVHPEDLHIALELREELLSGKPSIREYRIIHPADGVVKYIQVRGKPVVDANGHPIKLIGVVLDMSDRRRMEERLLATKHQLESFLENNIDAIAICNKAGKVILINKAFEQMYGWSQNEILGKDMSELPTITDDFKQEAAKLQNELQAGNSVRDFETRRIRKDGSLINVILTGSPIPDAKGDMDGWSLIARDITEKKRTEELLLQQEKLSIAGQLAAGVAHEIRNPFTSLKGFLQLSKTKIDQKHYEIMQSELNRINDIIDDFLQLAKPQTIKFQLTDLHAIIEDIVAISETQAILSNILIIQNLDDQIPFITCEPNQIKQVLINILKNAIEAMPDGGTILLQMKHENEEQLLIRIQDEGVGISEERIPKLGEPFYTTKDHGTGLGLMICYKIIDHHKGRIEINSELQKGTTVDIILPIQNIRN